MRQVTSSVAVVVLLVLAAFGARALDAQPAATNCNSGYGYGYGYGVGCPATVVVASGSNQSAPVGTAYGAPLVALVTDGSGHALAGVPVTFTTPPSGPSAAFAGHTTAETDVTNASGDATSSTITANTVAGGFSVTATAAGAAAATFTLTNTGG